MASLGSKELKHILLWTRSISHLLLHKIKEISLGLKGLGGKNTNLFAT